MPALSQPNRWVLLVLVMLAYLPVVVDMTILHIAIPPLTVALGASGNAVLWIIDIYPLLMAGLLVPMGTLADRIGNRRLLLTGLCIFGAASLMAAFAPDTAFLIFGRAMLALGAAMMMPCTLGLIRRNFMDPKERAIALGLWGGVSSVGAAAGPLVGGLLLEHFWWGSVFLINVPIILVVLPLAWRILPKSEERTPGTWSIGQALMLLGGIIGIVFSIKSGFGGKQPGWLVVLTLAAGLAMLGAFIHVQRTSSRPMLDLSLFSHPAIVAGLAMALVASGALAGVELTLAQELQFVLGKSPLEAGLFMLPLMIAAAVGGPIAGYLVNAFGLRTVASLAMLVTASSLAFVGQSDFHAPGLWVPACLALLGLALSIGLTASSIAMMNSVEPGKGGAAGSLEAVGYELGAGLGITSFGVFLSSIYRGAMVVPPQLDPAQAERAAHSIGDTFIIAQDLPSASATALIEAGRHAFSSAHASLLSIAAAMIALLAFAVFLALREHQGRRAHGG